MKALPRLASFLLLLAAAGTPARGAEAPAGAGTTATVGSGGYHRLSLYGDVLGHARGVDPYGWGELSSDNFIRELSLGGGVWKDLRDDLRVKGGAGVVFGRVKDLDSPSSSLLLETGIEKDLALPTLGAQYRLTSGSIVGPGVLTGGEQRALGHARGRAAAGAEAPPEHLTYNELSGYAKLPAGANTAGLRVTLGLPSYAGPVVDETLSLKIPVSKPLSVTPAVSFEQGPASGVYFSLSLYYLFY